MNINDIKTVLTDRKIKEIALSMSDEMLVEVFPFARAIEAAVLAASAPAQELVYWEYRHLDTCNEPHKWGEWERVDKSRGTLADLRQYIASGYKYELRPLYAAPVDAQDAVDAKRYRWLTETIGMRYSPPGGMAIKDLAEMNAAIDSEIATLQASQSPQDKEKT